MLEEVSEKVVSKQEETERFGESPKKGVSITEKTGLTFKDGFKFGLGFFTAGLVFYIIMLGITMVILTIFWAKAMGV